MFVEHKEVGEVKELDDVGRLLLKAADIIEKKGLWCGNLGGAGGRCILTALIEAEGSGLGAGPIGTKAYHLVGESIGWKGRINSIYDWNDARKKDEVVSKLRAVALGG